MRRVPVFVWVVVLAFSLVWISMGSLITPAGEKHDFLSFYTGASLALDGKFASLHDIDVQLRERQFVPSTDALVPFVRPSFYALLLAPLALIPFAEAFWVWIALQSALLLACWAWGFRRFGPNALVFAAFSLPGPLGIASGQDCAMLLTIFVVAFELTDRGRPLAGGAVLALMLIKFHLILLWPVALLLQRRWKMLAGFCAAGIAEACLSLALGGMEGARTYVALLRSKNIDNLSPFAGAHDLLPGTDGKSRHRFSRCHRGHHPRDFLDLCFRRLQRPSMEDVRGHSSRVASRRASCLRLRRDTPSAPFPAHHFLFPTAGREDRSDAALHPPSIWLRAGRKAVRDCVVGVAADFTCAAGYRSSRYPFFPTFCARVGPI
jgi:hypothetical protein